jgi:hypothetical protein
MNFDYHLLHAIRNGIKFYQENRDNFDSLWMGTSPTYRDKMFNLLNDLEVQFNITTIHSVLKNPAITCYTRSDAMNDMQPLADVGEGFVQFLGNVGQIFIYAGDREKLRLLSTITIASIMLFKDNFYKAGYDNLRLLRTSDADLSGREATQGEPNELSSFDILKKEIVYESLSQLQIKPIPRTDFEVPWEISVDLI